MVDRLGSGVRRMIAAGTVVAALAAGCAPPEQQQPLPTTTAQAGAGPTKEAPTKQPLVIASPAAQSTPTEAVATATSVATETPPPTPEPEIVNIAGEVFYRQNHDFDCTVAAGASLLGWAQNKYPQIKEAVGENIDRDRWDKAVESLKKRRHILRQEVELFEQDILEEYLLMGIPFSRDPNRGFSGDPNDFMDYDHEVVTIGVYAQPVAVEINKLLAGSGFEAKVSNSSDEVRAYQMLDRALSGNAPVVVLGNGKNRSMGKRDVTDPTSGGKYSLVPNLHAEIVFGTAIQGTDRRYLINTGGDYGRSENRLYYSKTINGWWLTVFEAMAIQPE